MYARTTTVTNKSGLHARPAVEFVKLAGKYQASIRINKTEQPDKIVNAKSIVMVLSLSAAKGTEVCIAADGPDEQQAVDNLVALAETGFGEE